MNQLNPFPPSAPTTLGGGGTIPLSNRGGPKRPRGIDGGGDRNKAMSDLQEVVRGILGDVDVSRVTSVNLDAYESFAHIGRGLAVALSGRATVVQANVASHLIEYADPLKLIMPPEIAEDSRLIVKRKQVLGANAEIVPESAPARVVSVKEVEHEVVLQRYGGDIEMNTNLLAMPEEYAEDLQLKLSFQQNAMARRLSELGYQAALNEGQYLPNLLVRANPAMATASGPQKAKANATIYAQQCFGALQKFSNPIAGLLSMAKRGSAAPFDTLILPSGVPEMEMFNSSGAYFFLNGISDADKRMSFGIDTIKTDPVTGLNIGTYRGCVDYIDGQLSGQSSEGGLTRQVQFLIYNFAGNSDADKRTIVDLDPERNVPKPIQAPTVRLVTACVSSAILGVSGSGSMVVGYPTTSTFSQPTSPEKTMIQLRSYLGAYLKQPENVCVLPDVFFEGIVSVEEGTLSHGASSPGTDWQPDQDTGNSVHFKDIIGNNSTHRIFFDGKDITADVSPVLYRGTELDAKSKIIYQNAGHLGALDAIDGAAVFKGGVMMKPALKSISVD
jgi:hypothetical protein